jgi:hypothetical protein
MARLHHLTGTDHSRATARDAGLTVTDRTLRAWLDGTRRPSRATPTAPTPPTAPSAATTSPGTSSPA